MSGRFLLALAGLCTATPIAAQTVTGVVRDSLAQPLRNAEVILEPEGSRAGTDSLGRYAFRFARPGASTLKVRLIGYRPVDLELRVPRSGTIRRDVRLERYPPRLATVSAEARRDCSPNSLAGFECRRDAGVGHFLDAGQLAGTTSSLLGRHARRHARAPTGDASKPARFGVAADGTAEPLCTGTVERAATNAGCEEAPFQPDAVWLPNDVVAIEYYEEHRDVPERYRRWGWWPPELGQPCGLIVYWLRGAQRVP